MRTISESQWKSLARALRREVDQVAPDWSEHDSSDPGVTLIELFAFLAESLMHRSNELSERSTAAAARLARSAQSLAERGASAGPCALRRVNYFAGQLLGADDFTAEQSYVRARLSRRNRALYGAGIVTGLRVSIARSTGKSGDQLHVEPGLAFDSRGEEIEVCESQVLRLPKRGTTLLLLLRYSEQPCDPTPASADDSTPHSRVAETFTLSLAPRPDDTSVALTRVRFTRGRWQLDRRFEARRVTR